MDPSDSACLCVLPVRVVRASSVVLLADGVDEPFESFLEAFLGEGRTRLNIPGSVLYFHQLEVVEYLFCLEGEL